MVGRQGVDASNKPPIAANRGAQAMQQPPLSVKSRCYFKLKTRLEGQMLDDAAGLILVRFEIRKDESSSKTPYLDDSSFRFYVSVDSKEQIGAVTDIYWPLFGSLGVCTVGAGVVF